MQRHRPIVRMLSIVRTKAGWRRALGALALLALVVKLLVPPGYMPGTSLAAPIMLCSGQGPMPMIADGGRPAPAKTPHRAPEHPCVFAGLGSASIAPDVDAPDLAPARPQAQPVASTRLVAAPGRGLAAPPPPSHAPPPLRA